MRRAKRILHVQISYFLYLLNLLTTFLPGVFLFEPTISKDHPDHFLVFLEMASITHKQNYQTFANPNEALKTKNISTYKSCPFWCFSSKIEKQRHISLLHPSYKNDHNKKSTAWKENKHKCTFSNCGLVFKTSHQLKKHKSDSNHFLRKRKMQRHNQQKNQTSSKKNQVNNHKLFPTWHYTTREVIVKW